MRKVLTVLVVARRRRGMNPRTSSHVTSSTDLGGAQTDDRDVEQDERFRGVNSTGGGMTAAGPGDVLSSELLGERDLRKT
jgi:hypothetical protein